MKQPIVLYLPNPFDPTKRELHRLKRPMTVRRFVRGRLRNRTTVRVINGRRVREFVKPTVCFHNGRALMRKDWSTTRITPGDVVMFQAIPRGGGGGGGGGGSNPLGFVLMVAVIAASAWLGPELGALLGPEGAGLFGAATAKALGSAIVGLAFSALAYGVMSLFVQPPPAPTASSFGYGGTPQSSPTYDLQAQGNVSRLGQPVPEAFGRNQIFPSYVSAPYSRYVNNVEEIHGHLGVGVGEYDFEELRIGATPISSFGDSITYEKIEPNAYPNTDIADPRWITCTDLAQTVLPGSTATPVASPWIGPFAVNPPGTKVDRCEIDLVAPRGLYFANDTGGLDARSATVQIQVQEIDDDGAALGDWADVDGSPVTKSAADNEQLRWTDGYVFAGLSRWQIRMRRTDAEDTTARAGDEIDWLGLRGRLADNRRFGDMTCIGFKMKATGSLNGTTSRQLNVICTRKLPTWDPALIGGAGGMGTATAATRSPCDAFAYIARATNGAGLSDDKIDLAGLYANKADFATLGWTFDYVFDQTGTTAAALDAICFAVVAQRVLQGSKVRMVRDLPTEAPVMMFQPRNIADGSVEIEYKMVDDLTADAFIGTYMSQVSWKPVDVTVAFDDSPQRLPTRFVVKGAGGRDQVRAVLWNMARSNKYRRRAVSWGTEMEGLILQYGEPVSFAHDMPKWGQSAEIVSFDEVSRTASLTEPLTFTPGATHYIAVRDTNGELTGPFVATAVDGDPNSVVIGAGALPEIVTDGDRQRTLIQFGPGTTYAKRLKVLQVKPSSDSEAKIMACDDDSRMYDPLPDEPDPGIGTPAPDVDYTITGNLTNANLRTIANANGFVGLSSQAVTIRLPAGLKINSASAGLAAAVRGTWPTGYDKLTFVIEAGASVLGAGAPGGSGNGGNGSTGGDAIDSSTGKMAIENDGAIKSGGGGGGGGGNSTIEATEVGGGGGGGG
ncbi:MAG TPA: host specificity factor TipJ family phage tail protein, partial [Reyranella sp.]|nr:host specificity factor TipJ family phage tail protein [Reyranella sp.]